MDIINQTITDMQLTPDTMGIICAMLGLAACIYLEAKLNGGISAENERHLEICEGAEDELFYLHMQQCR